MCLRPDLHKVFDDYNLAVKFVDRLGFFVLIICDPKDTTKHYLRKYHLMKLNSDWDAVTHGPIPELLDFHLQCCLAMHMRGGVDFYDDEDEEE